MIGKLGSKLDSSRPLWHFYHIGNTWDGKIRILFRIHHVYGDGVGLIRSILLPLIDNPPSKESLFYKRLNSKYKVNFFRGIIFWFWGSYRLAKIFLKSPDKRSENFKSSAIITMSLLYGYICLNIKSVYSLYN